MLKEIESSIKFVAVYIRKSRAENESDLEKHRMVLLDVCQECSFKYVEYAEVGTSDSIDMRPQMVRLLQDIEEGLYDAVLVVDFDRLSRGDEEDQGRIKRALRVSGTLIITPDRVFDLNNEQDDTYADFKGFLARQEYKLIKKRLIQGKKVGAKRGDWSNGKPPFPYEYEKWGDKYNHKGIVVNDVKFIIYRRIIDMALDGLSTNQIAIALNNEHIPSPNGGLWCNITISRMLADETHLGKIISNKQQGDGHKIKKASSKPLKKLEKNLWVIVENCHEAVKTPQEHEAIITMLEERRKIPTKARQRSYSLSGLMECKCCGHGLTFTAKSEYEMYLKPCWYKDPYGVKCKNGGIRYEILEKLIINEVSKFKSHTPKEDDRDTKLLESLRAQKLTKEKQITKIEEAIIRINDAFEMGDYSRQEWLSRREKRTSEFTTSQNELFDIEKRINNFSSVSNEDRQRQVDYFLQNINTLSSQEERNILFSKIISRIVWFRQGDNIELHLEYK